MLGRIGTGRGRQLPAEARALARALAPAQPPRPQLPVEPRAASLVLTARRRPSPLPRWHRPVAAVALGLAALLLLGGWTFTSSDAYPLVARVLELPQLRRVRTSERRIALVLRAPTALVATLAADLRSHGALASFALERPPDARLRRLLAAAGCEALPELGVGGPMGLLAARDRLLREAQQLGLRRRFYYLAPSLTLAEYLLVRSARGTPVVGASRLVPGRLPAGHRFRRGDIVVVVLRRDLQADRQELARLSDLIARQHLSLVTLAELLGDSGRG